MHTLPKELKSLNKKQTKEIIMYLSNKPLKELRKHQELIEKQIELAIIEKNYLTLDNLYIKQRHFDCAVMLKEFGYY